MNKDLNLNNPQALYLTTFKLSASCWVTPSMQGLLNFLFYFLFKAGRIPGPQDLHTQAIFSVNVNDELRQLLQCFKCHDVFRCVCLLHKGLKYHL